jgi:hypothetical protein
MHTSNEYATRQHYLTSCARSLPRIRCRRLESWRVRGQQMTQHRAPGHKRGLGLRRDGIGAERVAGTGADTSRHHESGTPPVVGKFSYHRAVWAPIGMHVIHQAPSAPVAHWATFEHACNHRTPEPSRSRTPRAPSAPPRRGSSTRTIPRRRPVSIAGTHRGPSTYNRANSVIETDYSLGVFSGTIVSDGAPTDFTTAGKPGFAECGVPAVARVESHPERKYGQPHRLPGRRGRAHRHRFQLHRGGDRVGAGNPVIGHLGPVAAAPSAATD